MKLYLTALILGTCLVLAGCPAKEPVLTTDETKQPLSGGINKTGSEAKTEIAEAPED
ncbi:MAG: hypothetical protein IH944_04985 [Armatimonadetes bacterium]|nr:hypothetical protein [Armatimonadota bacterium]